MSLSSGHGTRILEQVYRYAKDELDVFDVTVESPSPGFQQMRNIYDSIQAYNARLFHDILPLDRSQELQGCTESDFQPELYDSKKQEEVRAALRITKQQVSRVYDGLAYLAFQRNFEPIEKKFRLHVKRRLYQEDPELKDCSNKRELLQDMYSDELQWFEKVPRKVLQN